MDLTFLCIGTSNCRIFEENLLEALTNLGIKSKIKICSDRQKLSEMGVNSYPGLEIDGKVVTQGRLLSVKDIEDLLKEHSA